MPRTAELRSPRHGTTRSSTPPVLVTIGGGLVIGGEIAVEPPEYTAAVRTLLDALTGPVWQHWWAHGGGPSCELSYWLGGAETGVVVRADGRRVTARIERRRAPLDLPASTAVADVRLLLATLAERFGLPPAPPLPRQESFRAAVRGGG